MIQVTETVWLPYQENIDKLIQNEEYIVIHQYESGKTEKLYCEWRGDSFHELREVGMRDDYINPIAFSSFQTPCDPAATEFNFATAKRLMEGGEVCQLSYANTAHMRIKMQYGNPYLEKRHFVSNDDIRWNSAELTLAELNGTWRKV
jgi:hypothetical protein